MVGIASIFGLLEKLESTGISVHQHRCVVVRNRNVQCRRCAEACTTGCISVSDGQLSLNQEKCVRCATCASVCPSGAITPKMPDDDKLLEMCDAAQTAAGGAAIIACKQAFEVVYDKVDPKKAVEITCLGRVEESLLVQLAQRGADRVTLVRGACDSCEYVCGLQTISLVSKTANTLFEAWESETRVEISTSFPVAALHIEDVTYDSARRRFFSDLKNEIQAKAALVTGVAVEETVEATEPYTAPKQSSVLKTTADGTLPHFVPERRSNLLSALRRIGTPKDVIIATRLWGHVVIDKDVCESCRMCATFCPTGALSKFDSEDGTFGLVHAPALCVKCLACQDVCRARALVVSDEVFAIDLLEGFVERYEMAAPAVEKTDPHSAVNTIRHIIGTNRVYER